MTNLVAPGREIRCRGARREPGVVELPGREARLGEGLVIRRLLPTRGLRLVGPWCFLDHFGPLELAAGDRGMRVGPHPHIGLQTVTWLFEGEILHRDSLGSRQLIRPGQLNLMTAGRGITHSEETPADHGSGLHGVQLWVALPRSYANTEPTFEHHAALPVVKDGAMRCTLFLGEGQGERSPATTYTPVIGMQVELEPGRVELLLEKTFEHAVSIIDGKAAAEGVELGSGNVYDLGSGRASLVLDVARPSRLVLVGGEPLGEELILWWNFVGRTHEEIEAARADWEAGRRFGEVSGYDGARLDAPPLSSRLRPRAQ